MNLTEGQFKRLKIAWMKNHKTREAPHYSTMVCDAIASYEDGGSGSNDEKTFFEKKCANCMYFDEIGETCRRFAPRAISEPDHFPGTAEVLWPKVGKGEFCGEFERLF